MEQTEQARRRAEAELTDATGTISRNESEWSAQCRCAHPRRRRAPRAPMAALTRPAGTHSQLELRCQALERDVMQRESSVESMREEIETEKSGMSKWLEKEKQEAVSDLRKQLDDALANLLSCNESLKVALHGR